MDRTIAIIVSEPGPLPGQSNRSSGNFSTEWFGGAHRMLVEVTVDGQVDESVIFNIAEDRSGNDSTKASDVRHNTELSYIESNSLYICKTRCPSNKNFTVTIKPYQ
ncbi:hypothetical protein [Lysinibacillus xylanilyticus]|uniref:DeoR family transcriptional regulator n=1 Tax=Lysinibacillus xylanilyticus TaxID=582475 RepID=A0ABT4ETS9_9BACI|nr:hypothetical protein [Lysinibacillus xylanilyticus]MCY9549089.1 hypothetical protein [Lysinibacillus xylanilyticus]MED3804710.1 hypothetical protein [Lysinibacillus xylanilyticus]